MIDENYNKGTQSVPYIFSAGAMLWFDEKAVEVLIDACEVLPFVLKWCMVTW